MLLPPALAKSCCPITCSKSCAHSPAAAASAATQMKAKEQASRRGSQHGRQCNYPGKARAFNLCRQSWLCVANAALSFGAGIWSGDLRETELTQFRLLLMTLDNGESSAMPRRSTAPQKATV